MSHEDTYEEPHTLGAFLRDHREQKGATLADVSEATKISLPVLKAIEEDDHENMPAEAFCRGFYSLYANFLGLNQNEILERYAEKSEGNHKTSKKQARPPIRKSHSFSNYAEPSSISPGTSITFFVVICIILITGICYYFRWNPIDYINRMLLAPRTTSEQQQPQSVPDTPVTTVDTPAVEKVVADSDTIGVITEQETEVVAPETLPNTVFTEQEVKNIEQLLETAATQDITGAPYHLEIAFNTDGTLKVTLDDGFVLDKHFTAGETLQWEVEKKITLDMPESISAALRLNGIEIPLPQEKDGRRMLSLPEDLLN